MTDNRPRVIRPDTVGPTLYTRPARSGPVDRFEPGDALVRTLIDTDRFEVGIWEALPGESFWVDEHELDEFQYVISGEATVVLPNDRTAMVARAGEVVYMPAGTAHQTMNRGAEPLRVLYCAPPNAIAT